MSSREEARAPSAGRKQPPAAERVRDALNRGIVEQFALAADGSLRPEPIPPGSEQQAQPTQEPLFPSEPTIRGQLTMKEVQ